jgi:glucose-1-phosphate adenylyltransferase
MGIYVFERRAIEAALANEEHIDFGRHVLPAMLGRSRVQAYFYDGYWEDVGTVRSFFDANLALTRPEPDFNFYHPRFPIYSQRPFLAPSRFHGCRIVNALVADGCVLDGVDIESAIIGVRSRVGRGVQLRHSLVLGADDYQTSREADPLLEDAPPLGIGEGSRIENAIIDKNARVGKNVRIHNRRGLTDHDGDAYFIRDGIVIVPKGASLADGTEI